jgi:hypothetical protein
MSVFVLVKNESLQMGESESESESESEATK